MRTPWPLWLPLAVACSPRPEAPPLLLDGALATEGGIDIWWTSPGTAPGEETDSMLDDALVTLIDAATTSVDLALYEFDLGTVEEAVLDAWDRGVDVRMVGDGDEVHDAGYEALDLAGVPMSLRPAGNRIMHHKFAVVDEQAVWTGSTNVSHNGLYRNDNHAIIVRSEDMAAAYTWEFEEMFGGEFGRGKTALPGSRSMELADGTLDWHFAPTHDPIQVVVDAIDDAQQTVAFMVFSFTRADVVDALERAHARGVSVVGIFDESQANGAWSVDEDLAAAGVPVFIDGNENASGFSGGKLHHKVLIVDADTADAAVISGSMNWSNAGTGDNDENLVLIESPSVATPMMDQFCTLLGVATPHPDYTGSTPDLCDGRSTEAPGTGTPDVWINEVRVATRGAGGMADAFVELVSSESDVVDLTGWQLADDGGRVMHHFDGDKVLSRDALVLVGPEGAPGSTDRVSAEAVLDFRGVATLSLVDAHGVVVDTFPVGGARPGASLNRVQDGAGSGAVAVHDRLVAQQLDASPGRRMDGRLWHRPAAPEQLIVNELLADPDGDDVGAEFVELVNAGATVVDMDGYTLCDASQTCHTFAPQVVLPGQAVVLFDRGEHAGVPGVLLSESGRLSLNNSGDTLTLSGPDAAVVDVVSWTSSVRGVSWNRSEDGVAESAWSRHDAVEGSTAAASAGWRADGSAWSAPLEGTLE